MKFCIITHVVHTEVNHQFFGYSPYINEMNIWLKNVDEVIVVAPKENFSLSPIHEAYNHASIEFIEIKKFNALTFSAKLKAIFSVLKNCILIYKAMKKADHIHLRCPGNIGLLACIVQLFFPKKQKTAKYAGNWDTKSKQPLSYRFQKWILSSTFFTKNMQVLVYGKWNNQSKNIKPFFTATYSDLDRIEFKEKSFSKGIKFLFVGTLSTGKRPLYAIQIVENLKKYGHNVSLELFGEGIEKQNLINYIESNNLGHYINLKGNQNAETIKKTYQESHFIILPSKSEGWPKAVAEAMFMGCLPISTKVSCVPNMLDFGNRGILLNMNIEDDTDSIKKLVTNIEEYNNKLIKAQNWSQLYTRDKFEEEIKLLLQS
jgi:glycosyltransferase involved in cell wall biosynthesis